MKKIYNLFLVLLIAVGCYDDKGNYNYLDINELIISEFNEGEDIEVSEGEEISVKSNITPDITTDLSRYTFKWTLSGENRPEWNKKDFIWMADRPSESKYSLSGEELVLEITDTRFGTKYTNRMSVTISPKFISKNGYIILSEDESGNSKLHYMKYQKMEQRPDPIDPNDEVSYPTELKKYLNIYEEQNNNESLGKGPIAIQQHFISDYQGTQYCIFQKSGAVDIESRALKNEGLFSASFDGGNYPAGTDYLNSGSIMHWFDVMSDQKGRLFTRYKFDENLYNTGTFYNKPIEYEGEILEDCIVYRTDYAKYMGAIIFDKKNGRFLHIFDGGLDAFNVHVNAGEIISFPAPEKGVPENCRAFDDFKNCEILAVNIQSDNVDWDRGQNLCIVYRNEEGKIILQKAEIINEFGEPNLINLSMESYEIAETPSNISKVVIPEIWLQNYIFFIDGKKIYLTDVKSQNYKAELYYTAESDITALNISSLPWKIIFGTVDGFFYEIDIADAKNKISSKVKDEDKLLCKEGGFGKIVDVNFCKKDTH